MHSTGAGGDNKLQKTKQGNYINPKKRAFFHRQMLYSNYDRKDCQRSNTRKLHRLDSARRTPLKECDLAVASM